MLMAAVLLIYGSFMTKYEITSPPKTEPEDGFQTPPMKAGLEFIIVQLQKCFQPTKHWFTRLTFLKFLKYLWENNL